MIAKSLVQSGMAESVKIFYSYSRKDGKKRDLVEQAIAEFNWDVDTNPWKRDSVLQWYDEGIQAGEKWDTEIKQFLNLANIILLFVTQNFFQSKYIRDIEIATALDRDKKGEARVIPILFEITKPSWNESQFSYLQPLPQNCLPINEWKNEKDALNNVAQGIVDIIVKNGINPHTRTRWQVLLDTGKSSLDQSAKKRLVEELRDLSNDKTVRIVEIKPESVIIIFESSKNGFNTINQIYQHGMLSEKIGHNVLQIIELFGAHVHSSVSVGKSDDIFKPEFSPLEDKLLLPSESFSPILLKSVKVEKDNPLQFHNIFEKGDDKSTGSHFNQEVDKLFEYLLAAIATPEDEMFVNLAPDDTAVMLSDTLKDTRLGKALLDTDYQLKRLSASLMHPDTDYGKEFWPKVFEKVSKKCGSTEIPFHVSQRVWIKPEKAVVYEGILPNDGVDEEHAQILYQNSDFIQGFIVEQRLKTFTKSSEINFSKYPENSAEYIVNGIINELFEEIFLPIIEKEINEGKEFSEIRQIYSCIIIAAWLKRNLDSIPKLRPFIDTRNPRQLIHQIKGIKSYSFSQDVGDIPGNQAADSRVPVKGYDILENQVYFDKYMDIFTKGVFHFERYDYDHFSRKKIPRVYFAGAIDFRKIEISNRLDCMNDLIKYKDNYYLPQ